MKISTKGRYGLRAMVDLAAHSLGDQVALNSIAERQNISISYLEQVFSILRKAGIVKSIKGPQGGYIIGDSPSKITVGSILRVLEGELVVVSKEEDNFHERNNIEKCVRVQVWEKMNKSINSLVDDITLEDLVNEYEKMSNEGEVMYYI